MGRPEVIGYRHEDGHVLTKSACVRDGWSDERHGVLWAAGSLRSTDALVRERGFRPVYKPREFHASPRSGGYEIKCHTCGTTSWAIGYLQLPHDWATTHARNEHHYSVYWPGGKADERAAGWAGSM
jgi:hypothetical protein